MEADGSWGSGGGRGAMGTGSTRGGFGAGLGFSGLKGLGLRQLRGLAWEADGGRRAAGIGNTRCELQLRVRNSRTWTYVCEIQGSGFLGVAS